MVAGKSFGKRGERLSLRLPFILAVFLIHGKVFSASLQQLSPSIFLTQKLKTSIESRMENSFHFPLESQHE